MSSYKWYKTVMMSLSAHEMISVAPNHLRKFFTTLLLIFVGGSVLGFHRGGTTMQLN